MKRKTNLIHEEAAVTSALGHWHGSSEVRRPSWEPNLTVEPSLRKRQILSYLELCLRRQSSPPSPHTSSYLFRFLCVFLTLALKVRDLGSNSSSR